MEVLLTLLGVVFVGVGLLARFGRLKGLYIFKGQPGLLPSGIIYAAFPVGIWLIGIGIVSFNPESSWAKDVVGGGAIACLVLSVILIIWQPSWLKPAWLRWLEKTYGDKVEVLLEEARQTGTRTWETKVKGQADLEKWAESVSKKYGW